MIKPAEITGTALNAMSEKQQKENEPRVAAALRNFTAARDAHMTAMKKLYDTEAAIRRSEQERQTALDESAEAEQSWRSRFRSLRGNITPEMKAEHSQRVASRELADEFTGLIAELEDDRTRAMLVACETGAAYTGAHGTALTTYANGEWACALTTGISTALVRAFVLRVHSLEIAGESASEARANASGEVNAAMTRMMALHQFDMEQEPVLSVTGLNRPALTGVDMKLYASPASRMLLLKELAAKKTGKAES